MTRQNDNRDPFVRSVKNRQEYRKITQKELSGIRANG